MFLGLRELQSNGAIRWGHERKNKVRSESCLHDRDSDLETCQKHEDGAIYEGNQRIRMFLGLRELQSNGAIRWGHERKNKVRSESCLHDRDSDLETCQKHEDGAIYEGNQRIRWGHDRSIMNSSNHLQKWELPYIVPSGVRRCAPYTYFEADPDLNLSR